MLPQRLLLGLALLALPATASAAHWSAPVQAEHTYTFEGRALLAVSCPTVSLCVGVDAHGGAVVSTAPAGGRHRWRRIAIDGNARLTGISCPSRRQCVAVDGSGNVLSTTNPIGGEGSWQSHHLGVPRLNAVSCPSTSVCVAVGDFGDVLASSDPTGGPASWRQSDIDGTLSLNAVSCPTNHLCVAVDALGDALSTGNPLGGAEAWHARDIDGRRFLSGVSCRSSTLCLAGDSRGNVVATRHPLSASAWRLSRVDVPTFGGHGSSNDNFVYPFCASSSLCLAVDALGNFVESRQPGASAPRWRYAVAGDSASLDGGSCPSISLCVTVDEGGDVWSTPTPARDGWHQAQVDGQFALMPEGAAQLVCPSTSLCLLVNLNGKVFISRQPTAGAGSWRPARLHFDPGALACPSAHLCLGAAPGQLYVTHDPNGPGRAWHTFAFDPGNGLGSAISCSARLLCAAIDESGNVAVSTNPTGGRHAWRVTRVESSALSSVACTGRSLCVVSDGFGNLFTARNPLGGRGAWRRAHFGGRGLSGTGWSGLACPSSTLCLAFSGSDEAVASATGPAFPPVWHAFSIGMGLGFTGPTPDGLTCPSSRLCLAVDANDGQIAATRRPAGGSSAWRLQAIDSQTLTAVACPSSHLCLAADQQGRVLHSTNPGG